MVAYFAGCTLFTLIFITFVTKDTTYKYIEVEDDGTPGQVVLVTKDQGP